MLTLIYSKYTSDENEKIKAIVSSKMLNGNNTTLQQVKKYNYIFNLKTFQEFNIQPNFLCTINVANALVFEWMQCPVNMLRIEIAKFLIQENVTC